MYNFLFLGQSHAKRFFDSSLRHALLGQEQVEMVTDEWGMARDSLTL
jgi:hypothetical protein